METQADDAPRARAVMLAFADPVSDEAEAEFNDWYSSRHVQDVLRVPGVVAATRYRIAQGVSPLPGATGPSQRYVAIYELRATTEAELGDFVEALQEALRDGRVDISPAMDPSAFGASLALPLTARVKSTGGMA